MCSKNFIPFCCPLCKSKLFKAESVMVCSNTECSHSKDSYSFKISKGLPILISSDFTDTLFESNQIKSYIPRKSSFLTFIRNKIISRPSKVSKENCKNFIEEIFLLNENPKILIIGSGEKGSGTDELWQHEKIAIHGTDVYKTSYVDFISDSHYLPLEDNYYDGVWIQAVLEHVVEPIKVVNEIYRVMKLGGIVYAETPFMQQVHEGSHDFTRFTVLGHRYLFKKFELIKLGGNQGPEVVLTWSIRFFFLSIFRNILISRIFGFIFSLILSPFKFIISKESLFFGPSGVFFLGKKSENAISHKDLIELYKG